MTPRDLELISSERTPTPEEYRTSSPYFREVVRKLSKSYGANAGANAPLRVIKVKHETGRINSCVSNVSEFLKANPASRALPVFKFFVMVDDSISDGDDKVVGVKAVMHYIVEIPNADGTCTYKSPTAEQGDARIMVMPITHHNDGLLPSFEAMTNAKDVKLGGVFVSKNSSLANLVMTFDPLLVNTTESAPMVYRSRR